MSTEPVAELTSDEEEVVPMVELVIVALLAELDDEVELLDETS